MSLDLELWSELSHREFQKFIIAGGSELSPSTRISIENGLVRFNAISAQDKGDYSCEASNSLGSVRKTVSMSLTGTYNPKILTIHW